MWHTPSSTKELWQRFRKFPPRKRWILTKNGFSYLHIMVIWLDLYVLVKFLLRCKYSIQVLSCEIIANVCNSPWTNPKTLNLKLFEPKIEIIMNRTWTLRTSNIYYLITKVHSLLPTMKRMQDVLHLVHSTTLIGPYYSILSYTRHTNYFDSRSQLQSLQFFAKKFVVRILWN